MTPTLAPRLVKRKAPVAVAPVKSGDVWLGELHPRPGVFAVGRLRQAGSRGVLIHVVQIDATTLEIRHRLTEPDGPCDVIGTLRNNAGWVMVNGAKVPVVIEPRRRHAGWNLLRRTA